MHIIAAKAVALKEALSENLSPTSAGYCQCPGLGPGAFGAGL